MGAEQLVMRMLSSVGNINSQNLRTGNLTDEDWKKLTMAMGTLSNSGIFIDDTPGIRVCRHPRQMSAAQTGTWFGNGHNRLSAIDSRESPECGKPAARSFGNFPIIKRACPGIGSPVIAFPSFQEVWNSARINDR